MRYRETVRALASPRRALPIALLAITMIGAQAALSESLLAGVAAAFLVAGFLLLGPGTYRVLFDVVSPPPFPLAFRATCFFVLAVSMVFLLGLALPSMMGLGPTLFGAGPSLAISVSLFLVGSWGLARDIDLELRVAREVSRGDALAKDAEAARLLAMRTHLDPHFLFNTLNAIAEYCRVDGVVAERAILDLAEVLRTLTEGVHRPSWPLSRELALARAVLDLHHVRDPSRFSLGVEEDESAGAVLVPPLLLLPLVENAMTHGPAKGHRGEVRLKTARGDGKIRIMLENPGAYAGPREGGTGLATVKKRIALVYGKKGTLTIAARGERTRVTLVLDEAGLPAEMPPGTLS